jgi:hypothetical protein
MAIEGIGGHLAVRRVIPLRYYLEELGFSITDPSNVYMDNGFINSKVNDKGGTSGSIHKHFNQAYDNGEINLLNLVTTNTVVDILAKALGPIC